MSGNQNTALKRWCIVGAFSKTLKGGTSTFCNLIFDDAFFEEIKFYKIDSTLDKIPKDIPFIRIRKSIIKFKKFFTCLLKIKPYGVILFAGHGWGLLEKFTFLIISKLAGKKVIFFPRSGLILSSKLNKLLFYYFIYFSDKVVCQSHFWEKYITDLNPKFGLKINIIYNGIVASKIETRQKQNLANSFKILYAGWLEPNKGLLELIDAFKIIDASESVTFELVILGKGSLENKIKKIKKKSPDLRLSLEGWVSGEHKLSFFKSSDCFVLPSYYEGFPNVILEAMDLNLPVISTNISSMSEILDDGNCGLLFTAGNKNELVQCILEIKNDPKNAKSRAEKAKERVNKKFDIEISKQQLKEVLASF